MFYQISIESKKINILKRTTIINQSGIKEKWVRSKLDLNSVI